ncbi:MAG: GIY-YIG nuclease family protein [Candidatus Nomurabacteria bacterium]|nr:GIY-YIG nuclease family protein [Candidatus Nomurabacteria bacterium]
MKKLNLKKLKIPNKPGVYFFKIGTTTLYIGKATSLRDRTKSYFSKDLIATRGPAILDMVTKATEIEWQEADSVLEALILEANLIKKYKPKYNTKEKDNKSFNYVCITKDKLPKVLVIRGRGLNKKEYAKVYGPFPNGQQLKVAMSIIRRIFPFIDEQSNKKNNREFYKQLGLVPLGEYKENIKNLKLFFEGKKKSVVINLKKEMLSHAFRKEFEKAGEIKKRIFALNHINDVALIKEEIFGSPTSKYRIEAYDVAHMGGKNMVGAMTVVENGEVNKNEYRKFIIRTQKDANDIGALEEVLSRRFRHSEWGLPSLIVVDGSTAQVNVAKRVLNRYQFDIKVVGVVKDDRHKPKAIIGDENIVKVYKKQILLSNNEAHRFSIAFHKQKRNKSFLK